MFAAGYTYLTRLGRWPRRVAVLACLLLAATSALTTRSGPSADGPRRTPAPANPIAARLRPGQVAAPITVAGGSMSGFLHAGDHVDVYASGDALAADPACTTSTAVGTGVPVLSVADPPAGASGARLVVAVDRSAAERLAALQHCDLLAVLDGEP